MKFYPFALVSILNLLLIIYLIIFIILIYNTQTISNHVLVTQSNITNNSHKKTTSITREIKNEYDYYFGMDYTIDRSTCQSPFIFNTTETINSIETLSNDIINQILSDNMKINLQILRMKTKVKTSKTRLKQSISFVKSKTSICRYIFELLVGIDFPSHCNNKCQLLEIHRIISDIILLKRSSFKFSISKSNSIQYYIQNILLYQTVKYLDEIVYIKSIEFNTYISITIVDSDGEQTSVSISPNEKSLFIIKKGLTSFDGSSIYVSFVLLSLPNFYLRHEYGRIKLSRYNQSALFQQDATFKLIFDQKKNYVIFQVINLLQNYFVTIDTQTNTNVIIKQSKQEIQTNQFDQRFAFQIVRAT